jgi:hypothetical protein
MGTTPIYGFPYPDPSDLVANYPALGQQLAEDIEDVLPTVGGLSPAKPTTIANSGGTATFADNTTTFSGVTSVSLNGCFTSAYTNYYFVLNVSNSTGAGSPVLQIRYRLAGTDATGANYSRVRITADTVGVSGGASTGNTSGSFSFIATENQLFTAVIGQPALATDTTFISGPNASYGLSQMDITTGIHELATAYDGFTLFPSGGNMTGTLSVYGFQK